MDKSGGNWGFWRLTVLALDLGDAGNVACSEGVSWLHQQEEEGNPQQEGSWFEERHDCRLH